MIPFVPHLLLKVQEKLRERQNKVALKKNFGKEGEQKIAQAIKDAEKITSGEIVVRVRRGFERGVSDALTQAKKEFSRLKMHETKDRTAVLILLVWKERKFQIFADEGIASRLNQAFWDNLAGKLVTNFKEGRFVEPLCYVVKEVGAALADEFPRRPDDINEIPDDLSLDENEE